MKRKDKLKLLVNASAASGGTRLKDLAKLKKIADADQHGAFQHFQSNVAEYATRERYLSLRGGDSISRERDSLYGVGPEHEDSHVPTEYVAPHLSTRYSPDRVGIQAMRVSDGVFQDPYTNKVYDYNEGFSTEDGSSFPPGHASLQTNIMHLATHLDGKGFVKEADYLDVLLKRAAGNYVSVGGPNPGDMLSTEEIGRLFHLGWQGNDFRDVDRSTPSVRKALGLDSSNGPARENRPLTTAEISKLLLENNDAGSAYKLDPARLAEMTNGNLTPEEAGIVDGITSLASKESGVMSNLINLATHLDNIGMTKEANYLDALLRKTAEGEARQSTLGIVTNESKEKAEAAVTEIMGLLPSRLTVKLRGTGVETPSVEAKWSVSVTGFIETAEDKEADMRTWVNHLNKKIRSPWLTWGTTLSGELTIVIDPKG